MEEKSNTCASRKWPYAHTYYPSDKFSEVYDKMAFEPVKRKFVTEILPNLYEEVRSKTVKWPTHDLKATWTDLRAHISGWEFPYVSREQTE